MNEFKDSSILELEETHFHSDQIKTLNSIDISRKSLFKLLHRIRRRANRELSHENKGADINNSRPTTAHSSPTSSRPVSRQDSSPNSSRPVSRHEPKLRITDEVVDY